MTLARAHGRAACSFQSLAPGLRHWIDKSGDAGIAYADIGGAWVSVGSGLAPLAREHEVMEQFVRAGRAQGKRVRFFATEAAPPAGSPFESMQVGELPVWDPRTWPASLSTRLRGQLRRDQKSARVELRMATHAEIADPRSSTRRGISAVVAHWLDARRIAPMGFLVDLDPWHLAHERRYFVAEQRGTVVAALIAIPVYARNGWFLETMLRLPSAPNGTMELLFDLAMRTFAAEGSSYATFGMCPLSGSSSPLLKWARRLSSNFYNYDGLRKFKGKLGPSSWEPLYLVYPRGDLPALALLDGARAFMPGGMLAFAWKSAVQGARTVCRWLAYLTMLWISAFACVTQDHWFPTTRAKLARVGLDVLLMLGFLLLGEQRFWKPRALAVSGLAMGTFVLSVTQLLAGGGRAEGWLEWSVISVGTFGPLLSALFLYSARDRADRYLPEEERLPTPATLRPSWEPEPRR